MEGDEEASEPLVRVQFLTEHKKYRVTETSIAVPLRLARRGLSEVINHLLSLEPGVPFDFLHIDSKKLVRNSLGTFLATEGISKENVVKLQYAPALQEPEKKDSQSQEDWISCLTSSRGFNGSNESSCVVAACYDGNLQVYSLPSEGKLDRLQTVKSHRGVAKCVSQCPLGRHVVASGGSDGEVKIWEVDENKQLQIRARCRGHKSKIESVCAINVGAHALVASAGWDRSIILWQVNLDNAEENIDEGDETMASKRRKTTNGTSAREQMVEIENPRWITGDHTDNVSSVVWGGDENTATLFSGSWDHSLKCWDVTRECCTATLNGNKVVTSLSFSSLSKMLASGHSDNAVRLWDARAHGDSIVKLELKSHKGWVSDVAWSKKNEFLLASVSHDKTVKLWDIRSKIPLYTLSSHTNKVLCVDWDCNSDLILSGGAGASSNLEVHSLKGQ
mmetsp:Transcript_19746/g.25591  ORF Transcript_19746/g.25591 Transcript_19746/m.25591 type:complete len:448 (+) Transcript_19746:94-1437(+)